MTLRIETTECFPSRHIVGGSILPAPDPNHESCPGGGPTFDWVCPCSCHDVRMSTTNEIEVYPQGSSVEVPLYESVL